MLLQEATPAFVKRKTSKVNNHREKPEKPVMDHFVNDSDRHRVTESDLYITKVDVRRTIKSANFCRPTLSADINRSCVMKNRAILLSGDFLGEYRTCSILSADFLGRFYQMRTVIGQSVCLRTRSSRWSPNGQTTLLCV